MTTTDTPTTPLEYVRSREEQLRLLAYVVMLSVLAIPLVGLFRRGWTAGPGNLTRTTLLALADSGVGLGTLQALVAGSALTSVVLMIVDRRKRIQGLLLSLGAVLVLVGFAFQGFTPRLLRNLGAHIPTLLVGSLVTVAAVVPVSVYRPLARFEMPTKLEFRRAPRLLAGITTAIVVTMLVEAHVSYPVVVARLLAGDGVSGPLWIGLESGHAVVDTAVAAGFVGLTWRFVDYEAHETVMFVGPSNSGKTMAVFGALLEYRQRRADDDVVPTDASAGLVELLETFDNRQVVTDGGTGTPLIEWPFENTRRSDIRELPFDIQDGRVFPKTLTISALDYPGEILSELSRVVDGEDPSNIESAPTETLERLHERLEEADTIVFLLDVARVRDDGDSLDCAPYQRLVRQYRDETRFLVAASKADHFDEEYRDVRGRDPYVGSNVPDFGEFVTEEVRARSHAAQVLLDDADVDTVHPVYFITEAHEGERLLANVGGSVQPYGFVELLDELR